MEVRFGVWKYVYHVSKSGKSKKRKTISEYSKFDIPDNDFDNPEVHKNILSTIHQMYPGWSISGYAIK